VKPQELGKERREKADNWDRALTGSRSAIDEEVASDSSSEEYSKWAIDRHPQALIKQVPLAAI